MSDDIEVRQDLDSVSAAHGDVTITVDDPQWYVPWRTQLRWFLDLVWTKGWSEVWSEGLWWRKTYSFNAVTV